MPVTIGRTITSNDVLAVGAQPARNSQLSDRSTLAPEQIEVLEAFPEALAALHFVRTAWSGPVTLGGTPTLRLLVFRIAEAAARGVSYLQLATLGTLPPSPVDYRQEVLNDKPNTLLRFGDTSGTTAADDTGNGQTGTYTNGVVLQQPGALTYDSNYGVFLDGIDDYITLADHALLDVGDIFSLEIWVKRQTVGVVQMLMSKNTGMFEWYFTATNKLALGKAGTAQIVESTTTVTDTAWHHAVVTKTGSAVKLYLDKVDVTGTVTNQTMANNNNALEIGRNPAGTQRLHGNLDEGAVYPTVLSATRVARHYNAGVGLLEVPNTERLVLGQLHLAEIKDQLKELAWWMRAHVNQAPFSDVPSGGTELRISADAFNALEQLEAWDPIMNIIQAGTDSPPADVPSLLRRLFAGVTFVRNERR